MDDGSGDGHDTGAGRAIELSSGAGARAAFARRARARIDRVSLAVPMALLLGGALAFALFAAPLRWPLAQTPGASLRLLIAVAGGCVAAMAVWALFRRLERPMRAVRHEAVPDAQFDAGTPTLRRADAHPDAPARRPIFAAADLGAPLDATDTAWTPSSEWGGVPEPGPGLPDVAARPAPAAAPAAARASEPDEISGNVVTSLPVPAVSTAAPAPPAPPAALDAPASRDAAERGSAASLLARLDAALLVRTAEPAPAGVTRAVLRGALDELRKIGKQK